MNQSINGFWSVNFWGILGTLLGSIGILISYFSFRYNKPSIHLHDLVLKYSKSSQSCLEKRADSLEKMKGSFIELFLYISIDNISGGSGSIQRPELIIKDIHSKAIMHIAQPTRYKYKGKELQDLGQTFYLRGGEKIHNEKIEYFIHDPSILMLLIQNKLNFRYYVSFCDNLGKKYEIEIKNIQAVEDLS